jgi:hypothetical protein
MERLLKAAVARSIINQPLTLAHGGWGAQTHITPERIAADFYSTALVLSDGSTKTVIIDLDNSSLSNALTDRLRTAVGQALGIDKSQVRISSTHTHAGPVIGDSADQPIADMYFRYVVEQSVSAAAEAAKRLVDVDVRATMGQCHIGKNRRQELESGTIITGYNESGPTDPTVTVIRIDDLSGTPLANIVHYACHPTTLGFTNRAASPDYPGVAKRFVEQTVGGTCLFLQGAAGDIGPGPGGFLDREDVVRDLGVSLGCAAVQALIQAKQERYLYTFSGVVESGASLGIWERQAVAAMTAPFQVVSERISLPIKQLDPPEKLEQIAASCQQELERLRSLQAPDDDIRTYTYRTKRANMALRLSRLFYGKTAVDIEVQLIRIHDIALVCVPVEPFSAIGVQIRERSPFKFTLFSGYSNGIYGYLPTAEEFCRGGYEAEFSAFATDAADRLIDQVTEILHRFK